MGLAHVGFPHIHRQKASRDFLHLAVVVIAQPHTRGDLRGIADEPRIAVVLRRARLARELAPAKACRVGRPVLDHILHHGAHLPGVVPRIDALRSLLAPLEELAPGRICDVADDVGRAAQAVIGEHGVGPRQLQEVHLGRAQRERVDLPHLVADAEPARQRRHARGPDLGPDLCGHRVDRQLQRLAQGHRPAKALRVVFGLPLVDRDGLVDAHRPGGEPVLQRRRIDERLEARARLALGLDGAVELRVRIAAPPDHGEHCSRPVVEAHDRPLGHILALAVLLDHGLDRLAGRQHLLGIERGGDDEILRLAPHQALGFLHREVEGIAQDFLVEQAARIVAQGRDILERRLLLVERDQRIGAHARKHQPGPLPGGLEVLPRVEP